MSYGNKGSFDSSFKVLLLISICCEPTYATVPRYGRWKGFALLKPRSSWNRGWCLYLPDEHTLLVYLLMLFFSSRRRRLDEFQLLCLYFFLRFIYLFIYFLLFWIYLNWFCFCLGLAGNFYMTGFTKSIYFRARFVCISWVLIQSLQYADLYIHKLLMINVYFLKLQDMAIKFRN